MSRHDRLSWQEMAGALAAWSLGLLAVTGLVLYGKPWAAEDAELAAWRVIGLDAQQWADLHRVAGIALFVPAGVPLALGPLEQTGRRAAHAAAAGLLILLVAATLLRWPPVSWLLEDEAAFATPEAIETVEEGLTYPEAAEEQLAQVARNLGMDATRVAIALQEAKLRFQGLDETLAEIAASNGTTAQAVYDAIRHLEPPAVAPHAEGTLDLIEARFAVSGHPHPLHSPARRRGVGPARDRAGAPVGRKALLLHDRRMRDCGLGPEDAHEETGGSSGY